MVTIHLEFPRCMYDKAVSLRKTKTDKVDSKTIALMLLSSVGLKPYSKALYHNQ